MNWTLADAARVLGIMVPASDASRAFTSIVTDTRQIVPGCLFIALKGPRFDGHDFIEQARDKGAAAALVESAVESPLTQLVCPDTRLGLGLLAGAWRRQCGIPLVGITGNSGKTTVKEMTAALLSPLGNVLATKANLNNDIGVPLTLLRLAPEHQAGVIELGANHLGEIAWSSRLTVPDVAVITNVTGAHVGEFGGMGHIAQAKSELLNGLSEQGIAVLNRDDRYYPFWAACASPRRVISFGFDSTADVHASALSCDSQGRYAFTLVQHGKPLGDVQLAMPGKHNVSNALAAAAAALAIGVTPTDVIEGLQTLRALKGRLSIVSGLNGATLLDDTYNANPGAVKAAMETLMRFPAPRWCALGAMGELGDETEKLHAEMGRYAAELGIDGLLTLGDNARPACDAFGRGQHFDDHETLVRHVINTLPPNATLLVKGSRSAGMEKIITALCSDEIR